MANSPPLHPFDRALGLVRIDLHLHTTVSDGAVPPERILPLAGQFELEAIAVTDHDGVDAFDTLEPGVQPSGVLLITGVEIDTSAGDCDPEILGYGFDHKNPALRQSLAEIQRRRVNRAKRLIRAINRLLEKEALTDEEVFVPGRKSVLKPHLTDVLVAKGFFEGTPEAREFIAQNISTLPFSKPPPEEAIRWIHEAGGKAVLAHPAFLKLRTELEPLVGRLAEAGLDGLEGEYPYRFTPSVFLEEGHEREAIQEVSDLAERFNLVLTRGTDSHTLEDWDARHGLPDPR